MCVSVAVGGEGLLLCMCPEGPRGRWAASELLPGMLQRPLCDCPGVSPRGGLSGLDRGQGRAMGPRKGRLRVEGRTAGLRKLGGSQPFLCPLPLVGRTSRAHGHLRCWSGRAAYWAAGHPGQRWCGPSRGALGAIFSGLGWLPNPADYFWHQKIALKDVENFHIRNVWFPFGYARAEQGGRGKGREPRGLLGKVTSAGSLKLAIFLPFGDKHRLLKTPASL